jgi:hypothetical protein
VQKTEIRQHPNKHTFVLRHCWLGKRNAGMLARFELARHLLPPENTLRSALKPVRRSREIRANLLLFPENRFPGAGEGI